MLDNRQIDSKSMFYTQEQQYSLIFNICSLAPSGKQRGRVTLNKQTTNLCLHNRLYPADLQPLLFFTSRSSPQGGRCRYQKPSNQLLKKRPDPPLTRYLVAFPSHRLNAKQWVLTGRDALPLLFFSFVSALVTVAWWCWIIDSLQNVGEIE
ncbi:MAG: hypothetical protein JOS17DRAFT_454352 [Linnemannia elongata]|nr:MAG: hypothetical protein JOS17DRAFT_454352 [Linnemannia elongata]